MILSFLNIKPAFWASVREWKKSWVRDQGHWKGEYSPQVDWSDGRHHHAFRPAALWIGRGNPQKGICCPRAGWQGWDANKPGDGTCRASAADGIPSPPVGGEKEPVKSEMAEGPQSGADEGVLGNSKDLASRRQM